ncbi:MAG: polysaccharide biosynthesis C-terminal domain-containing protein, partial [Acidimicrobiales bacterium]
MRNAQLAMVLVPAAALLGFCAVVEEVLRSLGRPRLPIAGQGVGLSCTLALLPWATSAHGGWGAAVVSLAASSVATVILLAMTARVCDVAAHNLLWLRPAEVRA